MYEDEEDVGVEEVDMDHEEEVEDEGAKDHRPRRQQKDVSEHLMDGVNWLLADPSLPTLVIFWMLNTFTTMIFSFLMLLSFLLQWIQFPDDFAVWDNDTGDVEVSDSFLKTILPAYFLAALLIPFVVVALLAEIYGMWPMRQASFLFTYGGRGLLYFNGGLVCCMLTSSRYWPLATVNGLLIMFLALIYGALGITFCRNIKIRPWLGGYSV